MTAGSNGATMARMDQAVKMGADVVKMAKHVALNRNLTLAEYLTERIRPLVEADYAEEVATMAVEAKKAHPEVKGNPK